MKLVEAISTYGPKRYWIPYTFLLPFFLIFFLFWVAPVFSTVFYGLTEWRGASPPEFIGLQNYVDILQDPKFWVALKNTVVFVVVYNVLMIGLATFIALLLDRRISLGQFFRTAYLIPVSISLAVLALMFSFILAKEVGLLNLILVRLGISEGIGWLSDPKYAMPSIIMMRLWRATGYYAMIIFAGLQGIPRDYYEQARIAGANERQIISRITLPLLRPIMFFVIAMSTIWSFKIFDEPWILTGGGPARSTLTLGIYIYRQGFLSLDLGYATAAALILTVVIILVSALEGKITREL
jgi:ABC-type sugar transport system permease subunit